MKHWTSSYRDINLTITQMQTSKIRLKITETKTWIDIPYLHRFLFTFILTPESADLLVVKLTSLKKLDNITLYE